MRHLLLLAAALPLANSISIIQTNDDGWMEANLRAFFNVVRAAGFNTFISAPAKNQSGKGSNDTLPAKVDDKGCMHKSCPPYSPPVGSTEANPHINYVNSYPVTAAKIGIDILGPSLYGELPDLALSGPNVGLNMGTTVNVSGTVGAAVYAANVKKIPALAFSGASGRAAVYNNYKVPFHSQLYAMLAFNVTNAIIASGEPYLPANTFLNVNFPHVSRDGCSKPDEFKYVFSRISHGAHGHSDAEWCGSTRLPVESDVVKGFGEYCYASISLGNATNKANLDDPTVQFEVIKKLLPILSCLPVTKRPSRELWSTALMSEGETSPPRLPTESRDRFSSSYSGEMGSDR